MMKFAFILAEVFGSFSSRITTRRGARRGFTLAEVFCSRTKVPRGFTLAEVLITLAIIGVVAAMTIPQLVAKHRNKVLESQFKKASSVLFTIHSLASKDTNMWEEYVGPSYSKLSNDERIIRKNELLEFIFKNLRGATLYDTPFNKDSKYLYKTLDGKNNAHIVADSYMDKSIDTNGGMFIWLGGLIYGNDRYYIDTNGLKKGPNKLGYDLFVFVINRSNKLLPLKEGSSSVNECSFERPAHTPSYLGFGCAYYALNNISPDNPAQTYWGDFLK